MEIPAESADLSLSAIIEKAVAEFLGNQAALARALEVSEPSVSRWYSGKAKPDFASCLRLARITGLDDETILLAAGHDPDLLPPGARKQGMKVPLSVRQREVHEQAVRWREVMGPRMGEKIAEDLFWDAAKRGTDGLFLVAEATGTATNRGAHAAANRAANRSRRVVKGGGDGAGGPLLSSYERAHGLPIHPVVGRELISARSAA